MTEAEERELLERWCPRLHYDSQAVFYAVSPAAMTDAAANRATRGKHTVAAASGVPLLSLDWLRDCEQRDRGKGSGGETIRQGADRLGDARQFQSHPRYADRVTGRVREGDGAVVYLQYWLFFYSTPYAVDGSWDEPAWRLMQLELAAGAPARLVVRNGSGRIRQSGIVARARPYASDAPPDVFVSPLTNNLYFEAGEVTPGFAWDRADGAGRVVTPTVGLFGGWERWPGQWGKDSSVKSPAFDRAWDRPARAHRSSVSALLRLFTFLYGPRKPLRKKAALRDPEIKARLAPAGLTVTNRAKARRTDLLLTVHEGDHVVATAVGRRIRRSAEWAVELPASPAEGEVRASTLDKTRRSASVRHPFVADAPDELERAIFDRIVEDRLISGEVTEFAAALKVTEQELRHAIDDASGLWQRIAPDMQEFRRARFEKWRADDARHTMRSARIWGWTSVAGVAAIFIAWILCLRFVDADVAIAFAVMAYWLPVLIIIALIGQWRRFKKAQRTLAAVGPGDNDQESPLAGPRAAFERAISEKAVGPTLRERLNEATTDRYDQSLKFGDEGLPELRVAEHEVPTNARTRLDDLTERMRGGSIGIAGPRGAGKTTLIETFCAPRTTNDRRVTTVLAAPVRYEARDFILTLFGQLCATVLRGTSAATRRRPDNPIARPRVVLALVLLAAGAVFVGWSRVPKDDSWKEAALLVGGVATITIAAAITLHLAVTHSIGAVLLSLLSALVLWLALDLDLDGAITIGLAVSGVVLALFAILTGASGRKTRLTVVAAAMTPDEELRQSAEANLEEIRYQQTFSSGYSGKLAIPLGGEVGVQSQNSLARRQASLPELTATLRDFLRLAARARDQVVIGIDEMDKMESGELAQQFLNEIKTIFGVENVYYLVSISEGAMSSFERRGLPFRDVFDSSFDEVISVDPLLLAQSQALLRARVVGLDPPYLDLCHCLSGGLARDLLRVARQLSLLQHQPEGPKCLADVCRELIRPELERKVEAATVSAREIAIEPYVSELLFWVRTLPAEDAPTVDALSDWSAAPPEAWPLAPDDSERSGVEELDRIRQELAAYVYYLATVLKLFTDVGDDARRWFSAVETPDAPDKPAPLDRLARARIAFATNPNLAREIIGEFRAEQWPSSAAVTVRQAFARVPASAGDGANAATFIEVALRGFAGAWRSWRASA